MDSGFQVLGLVDSIPVDSEMDFSEWIPDSLFNGILESTTWSFDSSISDSIYKTFPGFRNPHWLQWGDPSDKHSSNGLKTSSICSCLKGKTVGFSVLYCNNDTCYNISGGCKLETELRSFHDGWHVLFVRSWIIFRMAISTTAKKKGWIIFGWAFEILSTRHMIEVLRGR